ncbi:oxidoreductase [Verrucomicrobium spinosum]|uniref:oxidoreductase n=1 Tax=Verrucomicrobium spinosum TaxID=2736 RepID=UPI0001744C76|nr:oxidoreductase [Verrucomicrobium spinosum]
MTEAKTWFITGCSSGFGRSIAEAALAAGHRVIATARDLRSIAGIECETCRVLTLDVTDPANIREAIAEAGSFDVLVNNAGYGLLGAVEECDDDQIRRSVEMNFLGPLNVIRAALPMLRSQKSGHIINISAAAAISNYPGFGIYGGAKAALEFMSESLRLELAPLGIHVTLVEPGPFRTNFVTRSLEKASQPLADYDGTSGKFGRLIASMNGKQPGDPARAAKAILAITAVESPPLRLVLGKYANDKARRRAADLEKERSAWETIGLPTEFTAAS